MMSDSRSFLYLLFLLFMVLAHMACGPHYQSLEGSFESTSKYYSKGEPFSGAKQLEITEIAWKGERVSKQVVIWTDHGRVEDINYVFSDLVTKSKVIPAENARFRFIQYARTDLESRACGEFLDRDMGLYNELGDVLSTERISSVEPTNPVRLWLTIDIPEMCDTGLYKGIFSVNVRDLTEIELKINLQVVEYCLPAVEDWSFHLDLWQFPTVVIDRYNENSPLDRLDYWSDEHFELLGPKYRLLADMGQKVITAHIKEGALGAASMIDWIKRADESWDYDFSVFDRYVDSLMRWGIDQQISCQSPVGWNEDELPYWDEKQHTADTVYAPPGSDLYRIRWDHFLTRFKLHLDSMGWFQKAVLFMDEVDSLKMSEAIRMITNNHPGWKIGMAGFHPPSEYLDSIVYDMSLMFGVAADLNRTGRQGAFYFSCNPPFPNNFIVPDARPADNIWIGWHAHHMNYNGFLRWAYDYWLHSDPLEMRMGGHTSGDYALCYRSSNRVDMQVYSSMRLELIREGIQDYEKIQILKEQFERSDRAEDQIALSELIAAIDQFTANSGQSEHLPRLVEDARQMLKKLVTGQF